ncbi:MAG: hypothetical protein OEU92_31245, partial [Alphaproteobacteria bacterium]|nr:hypothetical protein [Alphaproteobacteria bacterium]
MTPIRTATVTETVMSLTAVAGAKVRLLDKAAAVMPHRKHNRRFARWRSALLLPLYLALFFCLPTAAQSQPVDPHMLFEEQCGRCHGHAGTFARETLTIEDGEVVGR